MAELPEHLDDLFESFMDKTEWVRPFEPGVMADMVIDELDDADRKLLVPLTSDLELVRKATELKKHVAWAIQEENDPLSSPEKTAFYRKWTAVDNGLRGMRNDAMSVGDLMAHCLIYDHDEKTREELAELFVETVESRYNERKVAAPEAKLIKDVEALIPVALKMTQGSEYHDKIRELSADCKVYLRQMAAKAEKTLAPA